jgi:Fe-S-cluster-containing dehydrogenase component
MTNLEFFIDTSRCIGCRSCENACAECETHRGVSMIHVDYLDRFATIATVATVCMHCENPTCAQVCPADAIKRSQDGVVQSALKSRCVGCSNCVLACPFGVPKIMPEKEQMMKCDMCYDRSSAGKRPMCATVCPSQALSFVSREQILDARREKPRNLFLFGTNEVVTKNQFMLPAQASAVSIDATDSLWEDLQA